MKPGNTQISEMVNMEESEEVMQEVHLLVSLMFSDFSFARLDNTFGDIVRLFEGKYPGYRACNTQFHDLRHSTDALLAMARLIHGAWVCGKRFRRKNVELGLVSALMHDTGYIQTVHELTGTGARYTLVHIRRSIEFMEKYFDEHGNSKEDFYLCSNHLRCTGLDTRITEIHFHSPEHELLGKMLGTADLLGQMADQTYLEKLRFLFDEFQEGKVPGFTDRLDMLEKTPAFHAFTLSRMETELGGVHRYMRHHFRSRWRLDRNLYADAIEGHVHYLQHAFAIYNARSCNMGSERSVILEKLIKERRNTGPAIRDIPFSCLGASSPRG